MIHSFIHCLLVFSWLCFTSFVCKSNHVENYSCEEPNSVYTIVGDTLVDSKLQQKNLNKLQLEVEEADIFVRKIDSSYVGHILDRDYDPLRYSGKGYKTIRRFLYLGKNVLTQKSFSHSNTIYVIKYDFDLNGKTIKIPENSVLQFEGGSLSNGVLCGNKTDIQAPLTLIFGENLNIHGTFVNTFNVEWFGVIGNGNDDDSFCLQRAFDNLLYNIKPIVGNSIKIQGNHCYLEKPVYIRSKDQFSSWSIHINSILAKCPSYALNLQGHISSCILEIGEMSNEDGGCIQCISDIDGLTWMGTSIIKSNRLRAHIDFSCINLEAHSSQSSWINDNTIDVGRFLYGKHGISAKRCHQLLVIRPDFEYGNCRLDNCYGVTLIAPHLADKCTGKYVLETIGLCYNFNVIGGSCARFAYSTVSEKYPAIKLSNQTYGTIMSYQGIPEYRGGDVYRGTMYKIIEGNILHLDQPGFYDFYEKDEIYDTRKISGLGAPSKVSFSNHTTSFILSNKHYGGYGKINEVLIRLNNKKLSIFYAFDSCTARKLADFFNGDYQFVKLRWLYNSGSESFWHVERIHDVHTSTKIPQKIQLDVSGSFSQRPAGEYIKIGFAYFCTDRKSSEGSSHGIMIYYAGGNVWVDALGRVVN